MSNDSRPSRASLIARAERLAGPRPGVLIGFAALLVVVLAGIAYVVRDSSRKSTDAQATARREAIARFATEATISAQLTASIFASSTPATQAAATKTFGGPRIDEKALADLAARSKFAYAAILGSDGRPLAVAGRPPSGFADRMGGRPAHIRSALAGHPSFSDVISSEGGPIVEWALPFETPSGRRVEVEAFPATTLFAFFSGYLARPHGSHTIRYIVDRGNHVLGAFGASDRVGARIGSTTLLAPLDHGVSDGPYMDGRVERFFVTAPVEGSTWKVVLSDSASALLPPQGGSNAGLLWIVFGALALAGAVCLVLVRRTMVAGTRLAAANRELTSLNTTLEERVLERTAAAEERARDLARSNAELEQFASITSHDLQEPLRKIRMFGDRLQTTLGDDLEESARADLERMQNAAARMQRLINDLLSFSRVSSRGQPFEPVDLDQVTREVIADLEARVVELDAILDVGSLPTVEADTTQMRQLLQNLLGNALKFHRDGEPPVIRVRGDVVAGAEPRFEGEAATRDHAVITVEDNGIGFEQQYADRIFTAFERLHGRSAYDGTGIGLSIARKIVWRHGGDITARSAPGHGATFTVTLPIAQPEGGADNEPRSEP
jgi:signal transduction histidine kinase